MELEAENKTLKELREIVYSAPLTDPWEMPLSQPNPEQPKTQSQEK
jgi:hypothetical protein